MRRLTSLRLIAMLCAVPALAAASGTFNQLTYISGSTLKVEQIVGDHDWADTTKAVRSLTLTNSDVLGNDVCTSFVDGDSLILLFGDTIGGSQQYVPRWAPNPPNPYKWNARDPIAWSTTSNPDSALFLHFFTNLAGDSTLIVAPTYPDGHALPMGADNVPHAGVTLGSRVFIACKSGTVVVNGVANNDSDSSVVVQFHPRLGTFDAGRTLSRAIDGGHFLTTAMRELPTQFASSPSDSEVLIFGVGSYRHSDVYLSMIPRADFVTGTDIHGASATKYFTGLVNGQPTWSDSESRAVPIVQDDPRSDIGIGELQQPWPNDDPTIGNFSVMWMPSLSLWLMTYDGGRQPTGHFGQTTGVYFTSALAPWGPWQIPQLVFNTNRDGATGVFVHHYDHTSMTETGPAGPTIGDQSANNPDTTNGALYAPGILEPFVHVVGDTLKLDYTISTWNPYTNVRMRSEFLVQQEPLAVMDPAPRFAGPSAAPNPFRATTRVSFASPRDGVVDVAIYDPAGRRVRRLQHEYLPAGRHALDWDGASDAGPPVRPGLYFVRVVAGGASAVRRIVRLE